MGREVESEREEARARKDGWEARRERARVGARCWRRKGERVVAERDTSAGLARERSGIKAVVILAARALACSEPVLGRCERDEATRPTNLLSRLC